MLPSNTLTYPARYGWHTDQSFREQPADVSLFYCVATPTAAQQQGDDDGGGDGLLLAPTAFADGVAACASLPPQRREELRNVQLLHAGALTGRWEPEVRGQVALAESSGGVDNAIAAAATATPSRRRRLVRRHPETGKDALYMCDGSQLDYMSGPVAGMEAGPDRAGHRLVEELMSVRETSFLRHFTLKMIVLPRQARDKHRKR